MPGASSISRTSLALLLLGGSPVEVYAADLLVAMPNWPSGQAAANIIARAVEVRLGLDVEVREMGTMIAFAGLDSGEVDVYPEVWLPNFSTLVERYVNDRKSVRLSPRAVDATQNICVTRETSAAYGIRHVRDLADPAKSSAFDTDGDGRGEIWIGAQTWSSTSIERIRARSYGYDRTMTLLEMPEDVAMAGVDAAVATSRPIVFYCYSPHHVFQLHDLVRLEEPPHDAAQWKVVLPAEDPDWLARSEAPVAWEPSRFSIGFSSGMAARHPDVAAFLSKIDFRPEEITEMSYALQVERQDPGLFAETWVATHADRLNAWWN